MSNVLLTSVGRRSYLVDYFRQALKGRGGVICADMRADTPAMYAADLAVVTPASHDPAYLPKILEICRDHRVRLLCSFSDADAYALSRHGAVFRQLGLATTLPDADWGRITLDKYECTRLLARHGIPVPWTGISLDEAIAALRTGQLSFPVVIKARLGFGSLGLNVCHDLEEFKQAHALAAQHLALSANPWYGAPPMGENVLIQQGITGREYCIGIVNDLTGDYAAHLMCEVHAMRAGESDMATTVDPALAGELPRRISALTGHSGIWGVDCMDDDGVLRVIDINPRFTGDYPFNQLAGANVPAALLAWAEGRELDPGWLRADVGIRGYKDLVPTCAIQSGMARGFNALRTSSVNRSTPTTG
ncbi:ATP-grasp domain-containing protein [Halomonas sp. BM-2019]|uniref:ATP-grasp domain-containing protein n=1 Tax=Halomonas sp. BM-2019 TaxID=2811227 RepID=UPI001B3C1F6A|nr:MAG: ATP-grasp domain-containing protein [Halomonas sp. BM-2019]